MTDLRAPLAAALADRYRIERELGHGGMALVYLAHDLKHDRRVALKILRPELAAVIGAERFLNEIKVTANLQHPHILPLHDSGAADGFLFYVMPYVEGESLRDRLNREKQLGIDEAIEITRAVAAALDYAHRHGVIHRDIKPENILLHDGQALVADFGIALAVSAAGGHRLTETGLSVGTPQYMSPEQAMGDRELDARSDLYSLACTLYEMLAGDPPYTGSTAQAIVAKVITEKAPPITAARETVPPHVAAAIHKALAKLPADRFHTAAEFADALVGKVSVAPVTAPRAGRDWEPRPWSHVLSRPAVPWALVGACALIIVALGLRSPGADRAPARGLVRASLRLPASDQLYFEASPVLSRDGTILVVGGFHEGKSGLLLHRLNRMDFSFIPGTEDGERPFLSPDGQWVGFAANGKLKKVSIEGGTPVVLADATWGGGSWGANGTIVYSQSYKSGLWRIPDAGGTPVAVTTPDPARGELAHWWPQILPDGDHVLFTNFSTPIERARIEVVSLKSGARKILLQGAVFGRYVPSGHLLFARGEAILGVRFDPRRLEVTGSPVPVVEDVAILPSNGEGAFTVSDDGTLAYEPASVAHAEGLLVWVDRRGAERPVRSTPGRYGDPRLSPDGRRIALTITQTGASSDVWIYELARGILTRLTFGEAAEFGAFWTPDGRRVIYTSERPVFDLYWRAADLSQPEEPLLTSEYDKYAGSISPDGKTLAITVANPPAPQIWLLPLDGKREPRPYLQTEFRLNFPAFSPNGRWIAYQSNESGRSEIFLQSYPDPARGRRQVSTGGGTEPHWTRAGRELIYRNADTLVALTVDPKTGETGRPTALFVGPYQHARPGPLSYDVTPDGERFLMVKTPPELAPRQLNLVLSWFPELRRKSGK